MFVLPPSPYIKSCIRPVAEFKEFERQFKFKPRLKYGWFHLQLYQMFQDLSRRLISQKYLYGSLKRQLCFHF